MAIERRDGIDGDLQGVLVAARAGAPWAQEHIYQALAPAVSGFFRAQGVDDPDDLTSDVFVGVLRNLRCVRRRCDELSLLGVHHRLPAAGRPAPEAHPSASSRPAGSPAGTRRTGRRRTQTSNNCSRRSGCAPCAIDSSPAQRDVLLLRLIGDLTVDQVAATIGRSRRRRQGAAATWLRHDRGPARAGVRDPVTRSEDFFANGHSKAELDAVIERMLCGAAVSEDLMPLERFVDDARAMAGGPAPHPSAELAALLSGGIADGPASATARVLGACASARASPDEVEHGQVPIAGRGRGRDGQGGARPRVGYRGCRSRRRWGSARARQPARAEGHRDRHAFRSHRPSGRGARDQRSPEGRCRPARRRRRSERRRCGRARSATARNRGGGGLDGCAARQRRALGWR